MFRSELSFRWIPKWTQEIRILFPPLPSPSSKILNKCCFFGSSFAEVSSQTVPLLLGVEWGETEHIHIHKRTHNSSAIVGARDTSQESASSHWHTTISTGHILTLHFRLGNYTQNLPISCLIAQAQTFAPAPNSCNLPAALMLPQAPLPGLA